MDNPTLHSGLSELVLAQLDLLVERTIQTACAQVPWYRAQPAAALQQMFRRDYQALAQVLKTNDMVALRTYVEQSGTDRIHQGAPATGLIAGAAAVESETSQLITAVLGSDSVRAAESTRRVQSIIKNVRMILSGLNLRLLTRLPPASPSALH